MDAKAHAERIRLVGLGVYTVPDASRLTGVAQSRVRRWARGYRTRRAGVAASYDPIWKPDIPVAEGKMALSFLDMMEVRFVNAFRDKGVPWRTIREAAACAMEYLGTDHPFSTKTFKTDGRSIFVETLKRSGEHELLDLVRSQYAFRQVVGPSLYEGVEFDGAGEIARWWPEGKKNDIVIDPERAFGQPILASAGVPTRVIAQAYKAERSFARVAFAYSVKTPSVQAAIRFEDRLAA